MDIDRQSQLIAKGCEYIDEKNYKKARYYFSKALQKTGKLNAECKYYLGIISLEERDYYTAFQYFQAATEDNNNEKTKTEFQSKIYVKLAHTGFALGLVRESALYYINLCENFSNFENLANFYGSYLLSLSCIDVEPKKIKDESRKFNIVANHFINGGISFNKQIVRGAREKIHIAYMSPDYRNHVMFCFYYALLKYYDTDKFYVSCVSLNEEDDWS